MEFATKRGLGYDKGSAPVIEGDTVPSGEEIWWVTLPGGRSLSISWQTGTVPQRGRNGFQPDELLELVAERLRLLNDGLHSSRENSLAITKIDEAVLWLEERTRARVARGVEGTDQQ